MGPGLRGAAIVCLAAAVFAATAGLGEPRLEVSFQNGLVRLAADGASLAAVVEELARQAGLEIEGADSLAETRSFALDGVPLREALELILRDRNFVLRLDAGGPPSPGGRRNGKLWIHAPTRPGKAGSAAAALGPQCEDPEAPGAYALEGCRRHLDGALADDDAKTRLRAVSALIAGGSAGDPLPTLARIATEDGAALVRLEAIYGLGELGDPAALESVEQALADTDPDVRRAAIQAATDIGGDASAWALAAALQDDDPQLREEAVWALDDLGGEVAAVLLRQALTDADEAVRQCAAEALGETP